MKYFWVGYNKNMDYQKLSLVWCVGLKRWVGQEFRLLTWVYGIYYW